MPIRITNGIEGMKEPLFKYDCDSGALFSYGEVRTQLLNHEKSKRVYR